MTLARVAATLFATATVAAGAQAVDINCHPAIGVPGGIAAVRVVLTSGPAVEVAGVQNDLIFDTAIFGIDPAECAINPDIGPDSGPDKELSNRLLAGGGAVRNLILSLYNVDPIPDGELYTCYFSVSPDAPLGSFEILNTKLVASDPNGDQLPVGGTNCEVTIVEPSPTGTATDTSTRTLTATATKTGTVTPTLVATPTLTGYATPSATPSATLTRRSGGGGGGCSCKIDPDAPASGARDVLAVLLPALMLWLRRRARRGR